MNTSFERNLVKKVVLKHFVKLLILSEGHIVEYVSLFDAVGNDFANSFVRGAEGESLLCQIVGKVGCVDETLSCGGIHYVGVYLHCRNHRGKDAETRLYSFDAVKDGLLILLHILVICKGQSFEHCQRGDQVTINATCLSSYKLGHIGVFLLRHYARAGGVAVVQLDKVEFPA